MIDNATQIQPKIKTPRPYHQKLMVEVTRKHSAGLAGASEHSFDFFAPKAQPKEDAGSPPAQQNSPNRFEESFARMMVNLGADKPASASNFDTSVDYTDISQSATVMSNAASNALRASFQQDASQDADSLSASADQPTTRSAKDDFMDYMNQTDAEKLRQELTGVTKEQYEQMSAEEKLAVDQKVQQLLKKKQEIAEVTLKAKIAMAKATDSQAV